MMTGKSVMIIKIMIIIMTIPIYFQVRQWGKRLHTPGWTCQSSLCTSTGGPEIIMILRSSDDDKADKNVNHLPNIKEDPGPAGLGLSALVARYVVHRPGSEDCQHYHHDKGSWSSFKHNHDNCNVHLKQALMLLLARVGQRTSLRAAITSNLLHLCTWVVDTIIM